MQNTHLPDFIVIGAAKAGTTSLNFYLGLHPEIHMAKPKEPCFFIDEAPPRGRWSFGLDWYRGLFETSKRLCGEVSPQYARAPYEADVAGRIAQVVPEIKLIYLVREPLSRMRSAFIMDVRRGAFQGSFAEYVDQYPVAIADSSYGSQLEEYLSYFSREKILIVESDDLHNQRRRTLARILHFIGADPGFNSPLFRMRLFVGGKARFPSWTGRRILASRPMQLAKTNLPAGVFHHLSNLVLLPFGEPPPPVDLPPRVEQRLKSILRDEVALLRRLTGLRLASLEIP